MTAGLVIRSLEPDELDVFSSMPDSSGGKHPDFARSHAGELTKGHYRPHWTWVALRDGVVVARAAWWGFPDAEHPLTLDWLDFATPADGSALLRAAHEVVRTADGDPPDYHVFVPADWRIRPDYRARTERRLAAARGAGMTLLVERYSYAWSAMSGVPPASSRLAFRPVTAADTGLLADVLAMVAVGSLDFATGRALARHAEPAGYGRAELASLESYPSPRSWWRLGYNRAGELVGLAVPARNYSNPVIGYVAVLPEHRGNGYIDDVLAEATRVLVDNGADRIAADTDRANLPMAAAFAQANYRIIKVRLVIGLR